MYLYDFLQVMMAGIKIPQPLITMRQLVDLKIFPALAIIVLWFASQ